MNADLVTVRAGLELLHGRSPGRVHVCAKGKWDGRGFTDLDEAAAYALTLEQREGVYARCTTLRDGAAVRGRGLAADSLALPGLWADLDLAGPGHKAPAAGLPLLEDEAAGRGIVSHLPEPTLWVHSGGGLYPWWLFDEPHVIGDDLAEVEKLSTAWHENITRTAADCGWHVGGTGDLARVLRMPGTVNRKEGGERPCRILEQGGPRYSLDELRAALPTPPAKVPTAPPPSSSVWDSDLFRQPRTGPGPFDVLAEHVAWSDLLTPAGFTYVDADTEGRELWQRPGGTSDYSLKAGHHVAVVWSTDAGLPAGKGQRLTRGRLFAHLNHDGDESAAARDLLAAAHDEPGASAAARGLPQGFLTALADGCPRTPVEDRTPVGSAVVEAADVPGSEVDRLYPVVDWHELWTQTSDDPVWLCEPILEAGRVVALFSPAKTGKSLLSLEIAAALAAGRPVLGNRAQAPLRVLYVDLENSREDLRERLSDLGYRPADLEHLRYLSFPSLPVLDSALGGGELLRVTRHHDARLIVLDTVSRIIGGEEDSADTFRALYRHAIMPLKAEGRAVMRLDHSGKDLTRGQRGSSGKADDVDAVWSLSRRNPVTFDLRRTHSRTNHGADHLTLTRQAAPLRHVVAGAAGQPAAPSEADEIVRQLGVLGVPLDAGRPTCRKALNEAGITCTNAHLEQAVKARKDCPSEPRAAVPEPLAGTPALTPARAPARDAHGQSTGSAGSDLPGPSERLPVPLSPQGKGRADGSPEVGFIDPRNVGPCTACQRPTERYGAAGFAFCADCFAGQTVAS